MKTIVQTKINGNETSFQIITDGKWKPLQTAENMPERYRIQEGYDEEHETILKTKDWAVYGGDWIFLDHMLRAQYPLFQHGWEMSDEIIFDGFGKVIGGFVFNKSDCGKFYMAGRVEPLV